jgi:GR25 family glycosyltransferase involved in LPS biosynthesis
MKTKLHNFPPVYAISLKKSSERRENLATQFKQYGIDEINFILSERETDFLNVKIVAEGEENHYPYDVNSLYGNPNIAVLISHFRAIKQWYYNSTSEYAFFCEDDLSLQNVQYWNFDWENFLEKMPENLGCAQLSLIREFFWDHGDKFRRRAIDDWSATAYLLKREHAKDLLEQYCIEENCFNVKVKTNHLEYILWGNFLWALHPGVEHIIFSEFTPRFCVYSFPLFSEEIKFDSVAGEFYGVTTGYCHKESNQTVTEWWENIGQYRTLDEIF